MEMSAFPNIKTGGNGQIGKKGCRQKKGMSGKLADIDLVLARHVANMSPTFPTMKASMKASTKANTKALAGNVGICVCPLHPSNNRHFCLLPTCRQCWPDMSATFCYVGQFLGCRRVGETMHAADTHSCIYVGISTNEVVT